MRSFTSGPHDFFQFLYVFFMNHAVVLSYSFCIPPGNIILTHKSLWANDINDSFSKSSKKLYGRKICRQLDWFFLRTV